VLLDVAFGLSQPAQRLVVAPLVDSHRAERQGAHAGRDRIAHAGRVGDERQELRLDAFPRKTSAGGEQDAQAQP
jgi:hypothetical protein